MRDKKKNGSEKGVTHDSIGHGEWKEIARDESDASDAAHTTDAAKGEESPDDSASTDSETGEDLSAELRLGYRDYGVKSDEKKE